MALDRSIMSVDQEATFGTGYTISAKKKWGIKRIWYGNELTAVKRMSVGSLSRLMRSESLLFRLIFIFAGFLLLSLTNSQVIHFARKPAIV